MASYVYAFLFGEMTKQQITADMMGDELGIKGRTFRNKLNGITDWTWTEVCEIHKKFPQFTKEELFQRKTSPNNTV